MDKAMLVVGLGNPGREYQRTRHNVGFMAVDALAERWRLSFNRQRSRAEIAEGFAEGYKIILAKPQTFMNNSGEAVRPLLKMNNLTPANLLVIADDMDLPFGRLRLRDKGSSGGQRGIRNIIDQVGTDQFARLRVGIGRPPPMVDAIDYVLQNFSATQAAELKSILDRAVEGVETLLTQGVAQAMNRVNTGPEPAPGAGEGEKRPE